MCPLHLVIKMQTNDRSHIFSSKQGLNKVPLLFLDLKVLRERFGLRFWRLNDSEKVMINIFSGNKLRSSKIGASASFSNKNEYKEKK